MATEAYVLRHSCRQQRTARAAALAFTVAATLVATAVPGAATGGDGNNRARVAAAQQQAKHARDAHKAVNRSAATTDTKTPDGDALEVADRAAEYANERSAPGTDVSAAALVAARSQAAAMPRAHASATEVTNTPYNAEPPGYTDPVWSNAGAGFQIAAGRMTALAADGHDLYAGAADGKTGGAHTVAAGVDTYAVRNRGAGVRQRRDGVCAGGRFYHGQRCRRR